MNIGVIFAGGSGSRMHSREKPKQFLELFHQPIIIYTLKHFEQCPEIDAVVVSCIEGWIPYLNQLLSQFQIRKVKRIVPGGRTGQESIYHGLLAAQELSAAPDTIVLIHDGVRPLISAELLSKCIEVVQTHGSAITTGTVTETVAIIDEDGNIANVLERAVSKLAKAPQGYFLRDILSAHQCALKENRTDYVDSCTMMHHYGYPLYTMSGPDDNIKITTPQDYYILRAILEAKENDQIYGLDKRDERPFEGA